MLLLLLLLLLLKAKADKLHKYFMSCSDSNRGRKGAFRELLVLAMVVKVLLHPPKSLTHFLYHYLATAAAANYLIASN